ncbi:MAG TPA: glycosyltransferase family 1 protein [Candidatus Dormibacteraeota bacterium]
MAVDGSGLARPHAGVGTYTREILNAMLAVRPGHRLTLWVPAGVNPPLNSARLAVRDIPPARLVGRHWNWPRRIRRQRPSAYFGPAGQLPLGAVGAPAAVTAHDLAIYLHPEWFPSRQPLSTRLVVPRSFARARTVICVSRNTAADVTAVFGLDESRLEVIPEGVGSRFRPLDRERAELVKTKLRLPERYLLFVGTVEPRKNLDTLIEAWAEMRRRPPLVVAGGFGWGFEATRQRMARLASAGLRHLGEVEPADLPALYSLATALAHPAWYEGFGLTPLEAMACGTPVVCSNTSSLPEVVGEAALMVDPGDAGAWRRALERVCEDPALAGELRRKGLLQAAGFSWDTAAERTWRVIERAARG